MGVIFVGKKWGDMGGGGYMYFDAKKSLPKRSHWLFLIKLIYWDCCSEKLFRIKSLLFFLESSFRC